MLDLELHGPSPFSLLQDQTQTIDEKTGRDYKICLNCYVVFVANIWSVCVERERERERGERSDEGERERVME